MKSVGMFLIGSWKPESPAACTCGAQTLSRQPALCSSPRVECLLYWANKPEAVTPTHRSPTWLPRPALTPCPSGLPCTQLSLGTYCFPVCIVS